MRSSRPRFDSILFASFLVVGASALFVSDARAQDSTEIAAARDLGRAGRLAADQGRCEEAVDMLSRAKQLVPAPTVLVPLGECQIKLGKVVAGTENLQIVAREQLASDAPPAFREMQLRAREVLPEAMKKLARIKLVVDAPVGTSLQVFDNGEAVSQVLVGVERPADPGIHRIEVRAAGFRTATAETTVTGGDVQTIQVRLEPDPGGAATPPASTSSSSTSSSPPTAPPGSPPPPTPPEPGTSALVPAGAVILALGGAGVVVGAALGGVALGKKSDLDDTCVDKRCPASSRETYDAMNTLGTGSTVSFVVGGAAVALGAVLLGVGLGTSGSSDKSSATLRIGLGSVGIEGGF